jgi:probable rRNA maturation factor
LIDVDIADSAWAEALADPAALAERAAEAALAAEHETARSIALSLTDDVEVRRLNAQFRGKDQPTNVLAFPSPPNPERHLGDIALAFGTCAREADEQGKTLEHHLQHLVAHGVLHLLGYDHMTDAEAEEMEALERIILAGLGISDPYAAR